MSAEHGPNGLENYFSIHWTVMGHYVDQGFVVDDGVDVEDVEGTVEPVGCPTLGEVIEARSQS